MVGDSNPYSLKRVRTDGRTLLALSGEIDIATVDEVAAAVRDELATGPVTLDMSELSFMDSSGLRMLIDLLREADGSGRTLLIGNELHQNVRRLLNMSGIIDMLPFEGEAPAGASS